MIVNGAVYAVVFALDEISYQRPTVAFETLHEAEAYIANQHGSERLQAVRIPVVRQP